jgi:uncharacterized membrane protein YhaH (DUF805 family)
MEILDMEFITRIIPTLVIYGIIIARTRGRCSRYEYLVKGLAAFGIIIISLILSVLGIPVISFVMIFVMLIAIYNYVKYTIQRLYDLGMSGYYLLLTLIPIVGIVMTILLFIKKSEIEPNEYDEAIKYETIIKGKHSLNIYKDRIIFDDIEFNIEYYLKKYKIKISKYVEKNIFSDYLLENFSSQKENIYDLVEITGNDLLELTKKLELIVLYESQYIEIKGYKLFIRYYDFGYDIIINKKKYKLSKDLIDTFDFPGAYFEDEKYIYYKKVTKEDIIEWIKNVA